MTDPGDGSLPRPRMPLTRGFLFADLRGYTDFVQRRDDDAARDLLQAYRSIVRGVIRTIRRCGDRTEGQLLRGLPSASGAVAARSRSSSRQRARRRSRSRSGLASTPAGRPGTPRGTSGSPSTSPRGSVPRRGPAGARLRHRPLCCGRSGDDLHATWKRQLKGRARTRQPLRGHGRTIHRARGVGAGRTSGRRVASARPGRGRGRRGRWPGRPSPRVLAWRHGHVASPSAGAADGSAPRARPMMVYEPLRAVAAADLGRSRPHVSGTTRGYRSVRFQPAISLRLSTGWEALSDEPDVLELSGRPRSVASRRAT
jgi:hypothetical protein